VKNAKIIPFSNELSEDFRDLNLAWLETYFDIEPHDLDLLNNCEKEIIDKVGFIFFYKENGKILGTFALIKITDNIFEIGKAAISQDARGKGIGQELMQFCIKFSKSKNWKKLIMYSNTKLENSIYICEKYGFVEIPIEKNNPYSRSNIKMELIL
jgi:predicted GNAT family N-acyltransferase